MCDASKRIEKHAEVIWQTVELLGNQHSEDGDKVIMGRDALRMCCQMIDARVCEIVEEVASIKGAS